MRSEPPPVLGEPLAIELANTRFTARRDGVVEGLSTPPDLADWLRRVQDRLPFALDEQDLHAIGQDDLAAATALRDALRTLLAAASAGDALDPGAAEAVNEATRSAPRWPELVVHDEPTVRTRFSGSTVTAALAAIAEDAVWLLAGPERGTLRSCGAPGCILFFRKDHPRRTWCTPRCSDRVRAARHYARRTAGPTAAPEASTRSAGRPASC